MATRKTRKSVTENTAAPTRRHVTIRDHKDLSTKDIVLRVLRLRLDEAKLTEDLTTATDASAEARKQLGVIREDIAALEGIVEGRR